MDITIILPIHNEAENLPELFAQLERELRPLGRRFEVIAIDDGSTDGSRELLRAKASSSDYLKLIVFRRNFGQSAAFDAGFAHASGKVIVTMDSDLQNDPADIPRMIRMIDEGYDFVTGWRKERQDGFLLRRFPSRIANWLIRRITGIKIHDLGCSLKAYSSEIVRDLRVYGEMHRFISVLVSGLGARIGEIEVNHRPRVAGTSKYGISRTAKVLLDLTTVWFLENYRSKPIYVFGGFGSGLIGLGGLLSAWVGYQKIFHGVWVHRNPLFVIASFMVVIGVQFVGLGILAELLTRTYFESQGKTVYACREKIGFDDTVPRLDRRKQVAGFADRAS